METRIFFPLGKAYGAAFCNRVKETRWLVGNILSAKHTLLLAPRRFGKSSLAERAIESSGLDNTKINFHLCTSDKEAANLILSGVLDLIGKSIGRVDKLIHSVKKYVSHLNPKLSFAGDVAKLELTYENSVNYAVVISEALMLLENLLREKDKRAVIFLDEFQEVGRIISQTAVEGAIRTAAQEMRCLSIIFSGSVRSILVNMFENEQRPLYKLCRKLKLERISEDDYKKHLDKIAYETRGAVLRDDVFEKIMNLTNRHPYYVNYLCDEVWRLNQMPKVQDIYDAWSLVVEEEWSDILNEISPLPVGQRKVLKLMASKDVSKNIQSKETCEQLSMASSSIASAVSALVEKDYIEIDYEGRYKIINPLLRAVLSAEYQF